MRYKCGVCNNDEFYIEHRKDEYKVWTEAICTECGDEEEI